MNRGKGGERIGAYAFATADWKDLDYPFDLWLQHSSRMFDEVGIVTYGIAELPFSAPNIFVKRVEPPEPMSSEFYRYCKLEAQRLLTTDWKVLLDVDEFVANRLDVTGLDRSYAHRLFIRHLYANLACEIRGDIIPKYGYRIHHEDRAISGDGANVSPPCLYDRDDRMLNSAWDTGMARNPKALATKQRIQIGTELKGNVKLNRNKLESIGPGFDYPKYHDSWPKAKLRRINQQDLPVILSRNASRFDWDLHVAPKQAPPTESFGWIVLRKAKEYLRAASRPVRKRPSYPRRFAIHDDSSHLLMGEHEREIIAASYHMFDGGLFVDVGAHQGLWSIAFSNKAKRILAFEPDHTNVAVLGENLTLNRVRNVQVIEKAVADEGPNAVLYTAQDGDRSHNTLFKSQDSPLSVSVASSTLDQALASESRIGLLKVDTEGAEKMILEHSKSVLTRTRMVVIEIHPWINDVESIQTLLPAFRTTVYSYGASKYLVGKNDSA